MQFITDTTDVVTLPLGRGAALGTLDVEVHRFNAGVNGFIYLYGLRQIINDAMATKTDSEGNELSVPAIVAKATKRLENLYAGIIRTRGESAEPIDPVEALAWKEAKAGLESLLRGADQWKDIPKGTKDRLLFVLNRARAVKGLPEMDMEEAINAYLDKNPAIRREAKATIAKRAKAAEAAAELIG